MSHSENDRIQEACLEDFLDWYNVGVIRHANSWGENDEIISLLSEAHGCDEKYIDSDDVPDLFERIWDWDCELLCKDKRTAVEGYIMYQESMQQLHSLEK